MEITTPITERWKLADRDVLLDVGKWFFDQAKLLEEVEQIALVGSICTAKKKPKDIDFLVNIRSGADIKALATLARKLQGRIQKGNLGADVFIVEDGKYIGRACHYKDQHPRAVCGHRYLFCSSGRDYLCNTANNFQLKKDVIEKPALILWPSVIINVELPADVVAIFDIK